MLVTRDINLGCPVLRLSSLVKIQRTFFQDIFPRMCSKLANSTCLQRLVLMFQVGLFSVSRWTQSSHSVKPSGFMCIPWFLWPWCFANLNTKSFLLPKHVHILTMAVVAMSVVLHEKENIFAVDIVFFLQIWLIYTSKSCT